ncbi:trypsin-like peptidase domain-containing protein [Flavobacterium notoginsengisoli]|uniref:trypsin-like peptidase domain-containing protein n=1 Tax=Flavobacterium notoginsengisoli TaxID=1478199 RepID=UPI00363045B0
MPDIKSVQSVKLKILAERTKIEITSATGFLCEYKEKLFLITNWHVVNGRNNFTKELLDKKHGALPGFLDLQLTYIQKAENDNFITYILPFEQSLFYYNSDEDFYDESKPLWIEHDRKNEIDLVAIDLTQFKNVCSLPGFKLMAYNIEEEISYTQYTTGISVMDKVFIIGYPLSSGLSPNEYPIYKGATIASEMKNNDEPPIIFIDGKTKSGMSGSPVILKHEFSGSVEGDALFGKTQLIGVYSGRESTSPDVTEAELGIVWKLEQCLLPILEKAIKS